MSARTILSILVLAYSAFAASADEPLGPPTRHVVESPSKKYVATLDPKTGVTVREAESGKVLWESPKAFGRRAFLADDGEHLVTGDNGLSLIPLNYKPNLVLISFWKRDKKLRDVTAGELIPDAKLLVRTASHYLWGGIKGFDKQTLVVLVADRDEGTFVKFDVATGKVAK